MKPASLILFAILTMTFVAQAAMAEIAQTYMS